MMSRKSKADDISERPVGGRNRPGARPRNGFEMIVTNAPLFVTFVFSVTLASLSLGISLGNRIRRNKTAYN